MWPAKAAIDWPGVQQVRHPWPWAFPIAPQLLPKPLRSLPCPIQTPVHVLNKSPLIPLAAQGEAFMYALMNGKNMELFNKTKVWAASRSLGAQLVACSLPVDGC